MSPDSPEPETEYQLTPRTEAKYSKIDEEFQMMLQRNHINGQRVKLHFYSFLSIYYVWFIIFSIASQHEQFKLPTAGFRTGKHKLRRFYPASI